MSELHSLSEDIKRAFLQHAPVNAKDIKGSPRRGKLNLVWKGSSTILARLYAAIRDPNIMLHFLGISHSHIMWDRDKSSLKQILENVKSHLDGIEHVVIYAHGANQVDSIFLAQWLQRRYAILLKAKIYLIGISWNSDPYRAARNAAPGGSFANYTYYVAYIRWLMGRLFERLGQLWDMRTIEFNNKCGRVNSLFKLWDDATIKSIWDNIAHEARAATQSAINSSNKLQPNLQNEAGIMTELLLQLNSLINSEELTKKVKLHFIGFSAGGVFCEWLVRFTNSASIPVASVTLWGSGSTIRDFPESFGRMLDNNILRRVHLFSLNQNDESEEKNSNSILLKLDHLASDEGHILGLARNVQDSVYLNAKIQSRQLIHLKSGQTINNIPVCGAICHADFDDDASTFESTFRLIVA